jgi:hypothetical protein
LRVLDETGVAGPSYPALNRRLPVFAKAGFVKHCRNPAPITAPLTAQRRSNATGSSN